MDMEGENTAKAVLQPRRPGESIKVAETVLRRRDRNLKAAAERAHAVAKLRRQQKDRQKGKLQIVRVERLVKNTLIRQTDKRRLQNRHKKKQPKKSKKGNVLIAVRNGRLGGEKEVKRTLRDLGLVKRHTLTFQPNTDEMALKLKVVEPFVFWGTPSFKSVYNIVHKKALFRDPNNPEAKTPLSDNVLIEKHLGDLGLLCTEDLAETVFTNSANFGDVIARLWPVPLGDAKKANGLVHDKAFTYGDLKNGIDEKIAGLLGQ